jgi:hypothetical protein
VPASLRAELTVELRIQDSIVAGRSPLELTYLLISGAAGWTVFQSPGPVILRGALALLLVAVGTALAFGRIAGQDLTAWCLAVGRFLISPKVAVYGPSAA